MTHETVAFSTNGDAASVSSAEPRTETLRYDTSAKVNPPLRTPADVAACVEALRTGVIDAIATDHAPHADYEKACEFDVAAFGISGLETAYGLCMTLVQAGGPHLPERVRRRAGGAVRGAGKGRDGAPVSGGGSGRAATGRGRWFDDRWRDGYAPEHSLPVVPRSGAASRVPDQTESIDARVRVTALDPGGAG